MTELECVVMTVDYLLGILIIATVVGGICETVAKTSAERDLFRHRLDNVKNYLSIRHVDDRLELWTQTISAGHSRPHRSK